MGRWRLARRKGRGRGRGRGECGVGVWVWKDSIVLAAFAYGLDWSYAGLDWTEYASGVRVIPHIDI